ncbi:MAG: hypothetical protein LBR38_05845 [Synergistaceae bacterium]|jgi:hypothetical protein|nr:hypothetical protein [Synergistaceae bacterium]
MNSGDAERVRAYLFDSGLRFVWTAWRNIVRREFLVSNGLFFMKGIIREDEEWTPRIYALAKTYAFAHEPFYDHRSKREGSIMSEINRRHVTDMCLILDSLSRFALKHPDVSRLIEMRRRELFQVILYYTRMLPFSDMPEVARHMEARPDLAAAVRGALFFRPTANVIDLKHNLMIDHVMKRARVAARALVSSISRWVHL